MQHTVCNFVLNADYIISDNVTQKVRVNQPFQIGNCSFGRPDIWEHIQLELEYVFCGSFGGLSPGTLSIILYVCALSKYKYSRSKFVLLTTPPMHLQF